MELLDSHFAVSRALTAVALGIAGELFCAEGAALYCAARGAELQLLREYAQSIKHIVPTAGEPVVQLIGGDVYCGDELLAVVQHPALAPVYHAPSDTLFAADFKTALCISQIYGERETRVLHEFTAEISALCAPPRADPADYAAVFVSDEELLVSAGEHLRRVELGAELRGALHAVAACADAQHIFAYAADHRLFALRLDGSLRAAASGLSQLFVFPVALSRALDHRVLAVWPEGEVALYELFDFAVPQVFRAFQEVSFADCAGARDAATLCVAGKLSASLFALRAPQSNNAKRCA